MANSDNKIMRRRLANAYLSSVISISLVLLLVGIASLLLVNAEEDALEFKESLDGQGFIKATEYISKEQGQQEMAQMLGDDFLEVFEVSPIPASINVTLEAEYVSADSLEVVRGRILESGIVESVEYQASLVEALNANLRKISMILAVLIALLLFISFVLINNTVRLSVFSRRFTIHTMRLVGATRSFIRAPFLVQSVLQGVFAAFIAIIILVGCLFFMKSEFAQLFEIFRLDLLLLVMGIVLVAGVAICLTSTWLTVNKLVSLSKDELYY